MILGGEKCRPRQTDARLLHIVGSLSDLFVWPVIAAAVGHGAELLTKLILLDLPRPIIAGRAVNEYQEKLFLHCSCHARFLP